MAEKQATATMTEKEVSTLGDRMKGYEAPTAMVLDPNLPFMIRIDGHKFSSYTRPFKRPFDDRISNAMVAACEALIVAFNPSTVYTCSDEITLIFPFFPNEDDAVVDKAEAAKDGENADEEAVEPPQKRAKKERTLMFNGKVQKLSSLTAAMAAVAFDRCMKTQQFDATTEAKLIAHVNTATPYFDGRAFSVPSHVELVNNIVWRSHYDFKRNSISQFARQFYSAKQLHKLSGEQMLAKIKAEKGVSWDDLPPQYKYGVWVKKEKFIKTVEMNGKIIEAVRSRVVTKSIPFTRYSIENENFLISKVLDQPAATPNSAAAASTV